MAYQRFWEGYLDNPFSMSYTNGLQQQDNR